MPKDAAAKAPQDPGYERRIADSFARQGAMVHLGAELVAVRAGEVDIRLLYRHEVSQQHGFFHGGVVAAIGDSAAGYAAYSLMPGDASVLTVEYKINLVAPARGDALLARGRVVKAGRTLTVAAAEIFAVASGRETLCAVMQETLICLHGKPDTPAG